MKKLIQICTILSLLVVFSVVSANAQSVERIDAKIPFDFNIGKTTYKAGNYIIRVSKIAGSNTILSLEDENKNFLQNFVVLRNGNTSDKKSLLLFNRYEDKVFLSQISTPGIGFRLSPTETERQIARKSSGKKSKNQVSLAVPGK